MNTETLKKIGLTQSQANSYSFLVKEGQLTPPQLAKLTGESRTAAYMALAKLEEIGLAKQVEKAKKQKYAPTSPSNLDRYIEKRRKEFTQLEETYRAGLSEMLAKYYEHQRETGVQYFRGTEGLKAIYEDHLRTGKDEYLLQTNADDAYFGDWIYDYVERRAKLGVKTYALMHRNIVSMAYHKKHPHLNMDITWYPREVYTAPVEISAYGDKVSIISFGEEVVGTILESPQIAEAMKQLLTIAKIGVEGLRKSNNR